MKNQNTFGVHFILRKTISGLYNEISGIDCSVFPVLAG